MDEHDVVATRFEENRGRLRSVAYRMLGSAADADDAVQEAWLRLSRTGADEIDNLDGWLTTVVSRRGAGAREDEQVEETDPGSDPEQEAIVADSVGVACSSCSRH